VEKEIDLILIGPGPRNMDGSYGPAAQKSGGVRGRPENPPSTVADSKMWERTA